MKVVFCCLALVAAASAEERFNERKGAVPYSKGGLANKGRLSGVHPGLGAAVAEGMDEETGRSGCPPNSKLTRAPYQDMRDCTCNTGYTAYAWPAWGCYQKVAGFTCPAHSWAKNGSPTSMDDCRCGNGFARDGDKCVYAYIFHVHGRVWLDKYTAGSFAADESKFQRSMAEAINEDDQYNQYSCPDGAKTTKSACEAAKNEYGVLMGCVWHDADEDHDHTHTDQTRTSTFQTKRNARATCTHPANESLTRATKVRADDVLPYAVHEIANIQNDIKTHALDHSHIILAESDSDTVGHVLKEENMLKRSGAAVGFAIKLRGRDMAYGNKLINAMKKPALAKAFKTEFAAPGAVHVFVWALTAEFWRATPKKTAAPYTWAPKKKALTLPPTTEPKPTTAPKPLPANTKAVVKAGVTISCECKSANNKEDFITCLHRDGYVSMYDFPKHMQAFEEAVAELLLGSDKMTADVAVEDVSPAGLHPHNSESWSPIHADPYANGIEVHFRVASHKWGNGGDNADGGLLAIKDIFDSKDFTDALADKLANRPGVFQSSGWNLPKRCVMKNSRDGKDVKATFKTFHWETATNKPTPAPTPRPLATPGRYPNCVGGTVVAVKGHAEILSPAPVGKGANKLAAENKFLNRVRKCMAEKLEWHDPNRGRKIKACDILVLEGKTCSTNDDCNGDCVENWNTGEKRCSGFEEASGQIYDRPTSHSVVEQGNKNMARRLTGLSGKDPNSPLKIRHQHDEHLTIYRFNFAIYSPSKDMHRANQIFDQVHFRKRNQLAAFAMDVNECLKAGPVVAPKYEVGNKYRPSVPTFSVLDADSMELTYVQPQATTAAPEKEEFNQNCKIEWSQETDCSAKCGGGKSYKFGLVVQPKMGNGSACTDPNGKPFDPKTQSLKFDMGACNTKACPKQCSTGPWSEWGNGARPAGDGKCTKTCGGGKQFRYRKPTAESSKFFNDDGTCKQAGTCEGTCGQMRQTRSCGMAPCPVDCKTTNWGEWGTCSKQCRDSNGQAGKQYRRRTIISPAYYGGKDCGALSAEQTCNENPCPTNCVVSQWSEWGTCDKTCAGKPAGTRLLGAKQERTRYIVKPAANGGHECPSLVQSKLCALHPCGAHVCTTNNGFPLTCTYENNIVYTHHVNDVHDNELFMCYHNYVTQVCTCLCWNKADVQYTHRAAPGSITGNVNTLNV